jgi:pimeloyl-ACP methyl ester carboxylesterase
MPWFHLCKGDESVANVRIEMERWVAQQRRDGRPVAPESLVAAVRETATPLMRSTLRYDPRPDLRRLKVPILDAHGERDIIVPSGQSVPEIEGALMESENQDVSVWTLAGLDHVMERTETGLPSGDPMDRDVVDPGALRDIVDWVGKHTAPGDRMNPRNPERH